MEMLNPHCAVDRDGRGVVRLTICNAGTLNILSSAVTDGVREGLQKLAGDRAIRAVILVGQSEKSMIGGRRHQGDGKTRPKVRGSIHHPPCAISAKRCAPSLPP